MNNKNEVCIGEDYYLQLIDKVNEYDRLKELYERIYNENCILRENHNINDISLLDKLYKYKEVLDKIKEIINNKAFFDPAMPNCNALGQKATLEILKLLEETK